MDFSFVFAFVFVLIALLYSLKEQLELEKEILTASFRSFIQLGILGYSLVYILHLREPLYLWGILLLMTIFAGFTAQQTLKLKYNGFLFGFCSIALGSFPILVLLVGLDLISLESNQLIPIGGMVIGNALNVYTLAINKIKDDTKSYRQMIEEKLALGVELKTALKPILKKGIKSSLIPVINSLRTVGVVFIPGVAAGLLIAGEDPMVAVSYQLIIMYMIVGISLLTSFFTTIFFYKTALWEID